MIAAYARVSTEEQSKKGYSLRNQIEECRIKAKTSEIVEYVDDGYSGEFLERPALTKLREDVKENRISKVYCYDPDRLSRKLMNALIIDDEFRSKGVDIVYINGEYADSPEGKLFYSLRGAISEFEKAKITERMSSGRKRKAQEGKIVKNHQMYGYNYDKEKAMYTINEHEASVVQTIFHRFTVEQIGMNSIAKELTSKGIKTKTGKDVWHRQVVRQILMNESYTGEYYQNKWNTEGMIKNKYTDNPDNKVRMKKRDKSEWIPINIPKIIEREQYEEAAELLKQSRRRYAKASVNQYLLSGLVRCQKCGNTMVGTKTKWWGKPLFIYTDRKNHAGAKHPGCVLDVKMEDLDNAVWKEVKEVIHNPELLIKYNDIKDMSFEIKQSEELKSEIEKAKKGRKKLYSLFAMSDDLDEEEIKKQIMEMQERQTKAEEQLKELEDQINKNKTGVDIEKVKERINTMLTDVDIEKDITFDFKRTLIRMFVEQVIVEDKENITVRYLR
ncbi:recombinase family protein [Virgibacillus sp. Bac332]|uniref:recombinase family protein n=1 Tax=Virgibacillus sp. Bac332 TaxID=2419842 RepID=UPI000EF54CCF|nr:recombinase family protein [Virgibacillus sp. Bac332]